MNFLINICENFLDTSPFTYSSKQLILKHYHLKNKLIQIHYFNKLILV
jgi:hypothetical protein